MPEAPARDRVVPRPGGRSARVQEAVHRATQSLLAELGREALTVPLIAQHAGVTPSTIYRRWGDLGELLADVSLERLRPDEPPADTGTLRGDLRAWAEQYNEEMAAPVGRQMLRDVVAAWSPQTPPASRCAAFLAEQMQLMCTRAQARGEAAPPLARLMDRLVSPLLFKLLFAAEPAELSDIEDWLDACLDA